MVARGTCRRYNERLEQLFLMGNPCADYEGYREYAIATLTRLKELDGTPIDRSERIRALQSYAEIEGEIVRSCARYKKIREAELLDYREQTANSRADRVSEFSFSSLRRVLRSAENLIALRLLSVESRGRHGGTSPRDREEGTSGKRSERGGGGGGGG